MNMNFYEVCAHVLRWKSVLTVKCFVSLELCGGRDTVYNLHMAKEGKTSEECSHLFTVK